MQTSNNEGKKVLLRVSNLKQYFPLKKKGLYVKANDGITLDIYEGETFGLVGESGCGKSTLGRTLLQLYRQTDGRTMYYGRTLDDLAPVYVKKTLQTLEKRREKWHELKKHLANVQKEYDALPDGEAKYKKHNELDKAVKDEDDALLAVRKPAPLQVHPSPSAPRGADTLEGRVQRYLHSGAHPVHRLDAETTGIVLFAKLPYAQAHIQRQMQVDAFRKEYLAWVCGVPAVPEGVIDAPIDRIAPDSFTRAVLPGGQRAVTRYRVEHICGDVSLVRFFPVTGRTHQLRVHAAHIGHPMLGDTRYCTAESARLAAKYRAPYQQLSAVRLSLTHPVTGRALQIACPPDFSVGIAPL